MFKPVKINMTILEKSDPLPEKILFNSIGSMMATSMNMANAKTAMLVLRLMKIEEIINGVYNIINTKVKMIKRTKLPVT